MHLFLKYISDSRNQHILILKDFNSINTKLALMSPLFVTGFLPKLAAATT